MNLPKIIRKLSKIILYLIGGYLVLGFVALNIYIVLTDYGVLTNWPIAILNNVVDWEFWLVLPFWPFGIAWGLMWSDW